MQHQWHQTQLFKGLLDEHTFYLEEARARHSHGTSLGSFPLVSPHPCQVPSASCCLRPHGRSLWCRAAVTRLPLMLCSSTAQPQKPKEQTVGALRLLCCTSGQCSDLWLHGEEFVSQLSDIFLFSATLHPQENSFLKFSSSW